jgi:hypothetical protein
VLTPSGDGSRFSLSGTIEFNVPLVGGGIERFVAREFAQGIGEIQRFTTRWISEHV